MGHTLRSVADRAVGKVGKVGVREAQKRQTRQALLDAGLRLLEHQSLSGIGLREVTREAGITPTAFYRHFRDVAELGEALVEESFGALRGPVLAIRTDPTGVPDPEQVIDRSVEAITHHVDRHTAHFRFVTRERYGGVREIRDAINARLAEFSADLTLYLREQTASCDWAEEDLRMLADLYVDHMVTTAARLVDASTAAERQAIADTARRQLRLISLGRLSWSANARSQSD